MNPLSENSNYYTNALSDCERYISESERRGFNMSMCPPLSAFEAKYFEQMGFRVYVVPPNAAAQLGYGHQQISLVARPILNQVKATTS